ncbi:MerR family transcriptional regulator [Bacillus sp. AK128]
MMKEREDDILWDTVTILKEQERFENAIALFKNLIERTFSKLKLRSMFLDEFKMDLPSNEFVNHIRKLDKEVYESVNSSDTTQAYESLVEYIEKLSEIIPGTDRKKLLAKILEEQTQSYSRSMIERYDWAIPIRADQTEVYTSTEVAEILGVSDQTIRRWCDQGKYLGAYQTPGGHWRIPKKHFRVSLDEARKRNVFEQKLNEFNAKHGEVTEDEIL